MEFGTGPRYSQHTATNYAHGHYCYNNGVRPNPRVGAYPMGGPVCGPRFRGMGRDDGNMENGGQARRRISVACARCRKRKIRCSGDPGDGSGCHNCQQAGVDPSLCQFHRVGSGEATRVLEDMTLANNLTNISHLSLFNNGGPVRRPYPVPQLDTKPAFHSTWTVPYQEGTSPVENYNLEPPNAYLPTNPNIMAPTYGNNYRWNQTHDSGMFHGLPYSQEAVRAAPSAKATSGSPLNMSSLQISLSRTHAHTRSIPDAPQRQLPIPQPSPAQNTRNVVDQLQDQRLRSVHGNGVFPRSTMNYSSDGEPVPATSATHSSAPVSVSAPLNAGCSIPYLPPTVSESAETQPQLNFGTSSLLQTMPIPAAPATYSNFRNYNLPTSSSIDAMPVMARQSSQTNLYNFSPDSQDSKPQSADSDDAALVSGRPYTLLAQGQSQGQGPQQRHQPQHHGSMEHLRRSSCGHQGVSIHHSASIPNLARSY